MKKFDVLVLGGGLAGVSAALRVAELGGKVCLIEKGDVGTAGFQRRNTLFAEPRRPVSPSISWNEYRVTLAAVTEEYCRSMKKKLDAAGVSVITGKGMMTAATELCVQKKDGEDLLLQGKSLILACGSKTRFRSTLPREDGVVISIEEVAQLPTLPENILVIGGGVFASETAVGLRKRGCKVFLCYEQKELFPEMDADFNVAIERQLKEKKIKILAGKKIVSFYKNGAELKITLETNIKFSVHQIIIAGDRSGVAEISAVEKFGIRCGEHQKIFVDESMMTSLPGVYAVGSIAGDLTSDTLAQEEGRVAAENALGKKRQLNREWVAQVARLFPNAAYVGCNMKTAGHRGFHPVEGIFDGGGGDGDGGGENLSSLRPAEKYKIIADKRSRLIIGAQIISDQSADWIAMLLLLIKKGITVGNLAHSISSEEAKIKGLSDAAKNCLLAIKSP